MDLLQQIADGTLDPDTLASAAVLYMRAARGLDQIDRQAWSEIESAVLAQGSLTEQGVEALGEAQPLIATTCRAATMERCNFKLFRGAFGFFSPYHFDTSRLAILLRADITRLRAQHDHTGVAERFCALMGLCAHLADDGSLLSSSMGWCSFEQVAQEVQVALAEHLFDTRDLARLRLNVQRVGRADVFGFDQAVESTRQELVQWVAQDDFANHGTWGNARSFLSKCDGETLALLMIARDLSLERVESAGEVSANAIRLGRTTFMPGLALAITTAKAARTCVEARDPQPILQMQLAPIVEIARRRDEGRAMIRRIADDLAREAQRLETAGDPRGITSGSAR